MAMKEWEPEEDHDVTAAIFDHFGRVEGAVPPVIALSNDAVEDWVIRIKSGDPLPAGATPFWQEILLRRAQALGYNIEGRHAGWANESL